MAFNRLSMANPDQKTILIEKAYKDIKEICKNFQDDSGASDIEVNDLLKEIANLWVKKNKKLNLGSYKN